MEDSSEAIFDTSLKKKKKKKKPIDLETLLSEEPEPKDKAEAGPSGLNQESKQPGGADQEEGSLLDLDVDFSKAKKKKKKKKTLEELIVAEGEKLTGGDGGAFGDHPDEDLSLPWANRDYTYEELLGRIYDMMKEKNPEVSAEKKQKFVMKPPQVLRIGAKKTLFANFSEICKTLHRQHRHLLDFLLVELGTCGSVDGNNQLIIKGRFQQRQIENVLRRYIKEYVTCHTCKSPETILQKDTRLFFLQCEACGSRCSVASIKSGFQAVTAKRAAIRAKNV